MCIADLTGSISTDAGDLNSVQLSQSAFLESLAIYNWRPGTVFKVTQGSDAINTDHLQLDPDNIGVEVGMSWQAEDGSPTSGIVTSINPDNIEIDVFPNISLAAGEEITFTNPMTSCSILTLTESVQTKDRDNACVDFLFFFIGSGSTSPSGNPTTHIFTDDGFDFAVTEDQEILVWQGGATNQNAFVPANQLSIGTPLVSWENDIYQYVQITSISFDDNNSTAVNWTTTGTNSYQLQNRVVLRGFIDDFCSCKPSASINDFPCESTTSFCVTESSATTPFILKFSGSDSGGWQGSGNTGEGTTLKSWSVVNANPEDTISFSTNINNSNQELTMSVSDLTTPTTLEICYTESRILGPIELAPEKVLNTGSLTVKMVSQSTPQINDNIFSGTIASGYSLGTITYAGPMDGVVMVMKAQLATSATTNFDYAHVFVYVTGSHADLDNGVGHNQIATLERANYHFFCSNSADNGTLSPSHPSYSNAAYSLAWKINSASATKHSFPTNTFTGATQTGWNINGNKSGFHGFPSASYGHKPKNIVADGTNPMTMDYEATFEENVIHFVSFETGSQCPTRIGYANTAMNDTMDPATGDPTGQLQHDNPLAGQLTYAFAPDVTGVTGDTLKVLSGGNCPFTASLGAVATDQCCIEVRLNRSPKELFNTSHVCQTGFGTRVNLDEDLPFSNADSITFSPASGAIAYFKDFINGVPTRMDVDPLSHEKGKITLCYTASSNNPDCTDTASGLPSTTPLLTPDCCPAISGCVDIFFHPGFTAGPDNVHCYPTISLAGTPPIFNFTDTDVSQPTWSLASAAVQDEGYDISPITPADIADPTNTFAKFRASTFSPTSLTPFGGITNFTNSYVTEIHLEFEDQNPLANELHFGWFTMSCQVSNGPCTFTDTTTHYAAKTHAEAGPATNDAVSSQQVASPFSPTGFQGQRRDCVGGQRGPLTPFGLMQMQATASSIDPPSGHWSYVDPAVALAPGVANLIEEPNNPQSPFRLAICATARLRWTENSQSIVPINGVDYVIQCEDSDDVEISLRRSRKVPKFRGHNHADLINNTTSSAAGLLSSQSTNIFTASFLQTGDTVAASNFRADGTHTQRGPFNTDMSNDLLRIGQEIGGPTDTLTDIHVFGTSKEAFNINFELDPNVKSSLFKIFAHTSKDQIGGPVFSPVLIQSGLSILNNNATQDLSDVEGRRFRFIASGSDTSVFSSGSTTTNAVLRPFLTESRTYLPSGPVNPSNLFHTTSIIEFGGLTSASYCAASGSLLFDETVDKGYYLLHLTASHGECECHTAGAQARLFFHLDIPEFRFVHPDKTLHTNILGNTSEFDNTVGYITSSHGVSFPVPVRMTEPTTGEIVPVFRDVFAVTFVSESVRVSTTASSVIYHHDDARKQNPVMPFLTSSVIGFHRGHGDSGGVKPPTNKSSSLSAIADGINVVETDLDGETAPAFPLSYLDVDLASGVVRRSHILNNLNTFTGATQSRTIGEDMFRSMQHAEKLFNHEVRGYSSTEFYRRFYLNPGAGMSDAGFGVNFQWKAREIAVYNQSGAPLVHGTDIPEAVITGSFLDTFTSESFIEAPTFLPAQRAYSQSIASNKYDGYNHTVIRGSNYFDGLESGGSGHHVPYYSPIINAHGNNYSSVITQSVMFECTASVKDFDGRILKQYHATQSMMFIMTETRT